MRTLILCGCPGKNGQFALCPRNNSRIHHLPPRGWLRIGHVFSLHVVMKPDDSHAATRTQKSFHLSIQPPNHLGEAWRRKLTYPGHLEKNAFMPVLSGQMMMTAFGTSTRWFQQQSPSPTKACPRKYVKPTDVLRLCEEI